MPAGPQQIVFKRRPAFGGHWADCPEAKTGWPAKAIKLYVTPAGVTGTCGQTHRPRGDDGRKARPAECVFQVEQVTKEELQALAAPGKTGRVRGKLPTGKSVDGQIISFGARAAGSQAGGGNAAQAFAAAKNGKGAAAPAAPAQVPRGGSGAMTAFFGAVAATAGAVGQARGLSRGRGHRTVSRPGGTRRCTTARGAAGRRSVRPRPRSQGLGACPWLRRPST
ncbi:hypothetical protein [Streptomyces sp. NBC_00390]|uniref:hypothetical protein n=1 Tax=Streptomyces sp. NBC_00390 TaxID=2975736 RepID=UPI003FCD6B57